MISTFMCNKKNVGGTFHLHAFKHVNSNLACDEEAKIQRSIGMQPTPEPDARTDWLIRERNRALRLQSKGSLQTHLTLHEPIPILLNQQTLIAQ